MLYSGGDREPDTEEERMLNLKLFTGQDYNRLLFSTEQEVTATSNDKEKKKGGGGVKT